MRLQASRTLWTSILVLQLGALGSAQDADTSDTRSKELEAKWGTDVS